jgi:hypothetical protein
VYWRGSSTLDTAELAKVLKVYTEMDLGGKSTASRYAIAKLFASMDQDGSGEVDFHEVRGSVRCVSCRNLPPSGTSTRLFLVFAKLIESCGTVSKTKEGAEFMGFCRERICRQFWKPPVPAALLFA